MKIGILTFYFPYNYGAVLQAFALQTVLRGNGYDTEVVPYYPRNFKMAYSVSPLESGISFKHRLSNAYHYQQRIEQSKKFDSFRHDLLIDDEFDKDFATHVKKYDCIIYGSDQIWNTEINYDDPVYFGADFKGVKISFAASMGKVSPVEKQKEYVQKYLPEFQSISVREETTGRIVGELTGKETTTVCDPVFLLDKEEWVRNETRIDVDSKYLLVYMLADDDKLLSAAVDYAKKSNLTVYNIHPTFAKDYPGTKPLRNVGPREFVYLMDHAEAVCTNSFHCVAFSLIFEKKLFHVPNKKSPERTISLLSKIGVDASQMDLTTPVQLAITEEFSKYSDESLKFLINALQ